MTNQGLGNPKIHEIYKGVFAITGLYHVSDGIDTNAGIIITQQAVVFIDSGMTISSAEFLWQLAQNHMAGEKELYLILTHHHSDHVFGMRVMKEKGARVIAHSAACEFLENDCGKYKRFIKKFMDCDSEEADTILGDVKLSIPDILIEIDTTLHVGTELKLLVTPGHVPSSISVYHPTSKTLFAGDTVYEGSPLNTRVGGPKEWRVWVSQLERLKMLNIDKICPGHGDLCSKEEFARNIKYLLNLLASEK